MIEPEEHLPAEPPRAEPVRPVDVAPTGLAAVDATQTWADVEALVVSVTGDRRRLYYLNATGRTPELVAHWQQGPYAILDETLSMPVELPPELTDSVQRQGHGHLVAWVAATTADGTPFPVESVGQVVLLPEGTAVVGTMGVGRDEAAGLSPSAGVASVVWAEGEVPR